MKQFRTLCYLLCILVVSFLLPNSNARAEAPNPSEETKTPIKHFLVLMQENHTFDNYFGKYPGANGIPEGTCIPVDPFDAANTECVEPFHIGDRPIEDLDHSDKCFQF